MATVTVIAARSFSHAGRMIAAGEPVTVASAQAAALARRGMVTLDRQARPTYQTREMVAAPPAQEIVEPPARRRRPRRSRSQASDSGETE